MSRVVIDASVAIKWVVPERETDEALTLLSAGGLCAPDLIVPECANILWKKTKYQELTRNEARVAARLLEHAELEILPSRALLAAAAELAIDLDHAAYDCLYLALAMARGGVFVTADDRFIQKLRLQGPGRFDDLALSLSAAALKAREK